MRVRVRLVQGVVSPHALMNGDDVRLLVREVVGRVREARGLAIESEQVSRHVVAGAHSLQYLGVAFRDRSELRVAVLARSGDRSDRDAAYHPPLAPPALIS